MTSPLRRRLLPALAAPLLLAGLLTTAPAAQAARAARLAPGAPAPRAAFGASGPRLAGGHVTAVPRVPARLPVAIEPMSSYVAADSCDPTAKPGAVAFGDLLRRTYPGTSYGISRACGVDPLPTSEHYDGRALDWFVSVHDPAQRAEAQAVIHWLFARDDAGNRYANARRLGIMYIIWNNRIWGAYRPQDGWRPYSDCAQHPGPAYDTTCHRDHVHFSLSWDGAMRRTSFWTHRVPAPDYGPCRPADLNWAGPYRRQRLTPCPAYPVVRAPRRASVLDRALTAYSGMLLRRGSTGPAVTAVQQAVGTTADGVLGRSTVLAVRAWKAAHGLPVDGVIGAGTWRALLAANAPVTADDPSAGPAGRRTP